ncbi:MAG: hypothetical protein IKG21_09215 [Atopobiaceae bacterium]|nr:hypothetical protein [Atopobiaceae bacterium]
MESLDLKTLTIILRSFSNEITATGLASDFGVSYSTLARGNRTGTWPPSITEGAVRGAIDGYRNRFFGGNGEALAQFVLEQLHTMGLDTAALEDALAQGGYGAFVATLVSTTRNPQPKEAASESVPITTRKQVLAPSANAAPQKVPARTVIPAPSAIAARSATDAVPHALTLTVAPTQPGPTRMSNMPSRAHDLLLALPVAIVLLIGSLNVSLGDLFVWVAQHRFAFCAISLGIAVLPSALGVLVDAPIAWRAWRKDHPDAEFSWDAFRYVAKYGSTEGIAPGAGRFNLTLPYLLYQPVCNVLSTMCCLAELTFVLSLPGFQEFFCGHEWVEYLKVSVALAYYVAYEFTSDNWRRPLAGDPSTEICENPDNYLPSRVHVWPNIAHLTWTVSVLMVLLLAMLAWGITNFRSTPAPILMLWPYAQAVVFYAFSSASSYAVRIRATGVGMFLPGVAAISLAFVAYALICFAPSIGTVLVLLTCTTCFAGTVVWVRRARYGEGAQWLEQNRVSGAYVVTVTATIIAMLVAGIATLAFA